MKTEVSRPISGVWQALSEVPGWPDAPLVVRLRRMWPLALPLFSCVALVVWTSFVREPLRQAVRTANAEMLTLEQEAEQLRQALSDQTAVEITGRAAAARAQLLESPAVLQERLQAYAIQARSAGWEVTFQTYGLSEDGSAAGETAQLVYAPARVHLEPRAENTDRFNTLIGTLAGLAATPGRVEITRVSIRADLPGVPVVDVNIRAACRPTHEKAAE